MRRDFDRIVETGYPDKLRRILEGDDDDFYDNRTFTQNIIDYVFTMKTLYSLSKDSDEIGFLAKSLYAYFVKKGHKHFRQVVTRMQFVYIPSDN